MVAPNGSCAVCFTVLTLLGILSILICVGIGTVRQRRLDGTAVREPYSEVSVGCNPVWQALCAVKKGNVHYLERGLSHDKPNSRFADWN